MGNCSSADRRGSFMRKRGRSFQTKDEDICAYGTRTSLDKEEEEEEEERQKLVNREEEQGTDKGVVPSDSGIESLGPSTDDSQEDTCRKCNHRTLSPPSCQQCGQCKVNTVKDSPCRSEPDTYCSCGPRNARLHTWQKNLICKTHPHSPKFYRHSDVIDTKSSLKKGRRRVPERRSQLSCKSSDSLDYAGAMNTSMDNAKSVVSDIFSDDVSLKAPLAAFDSVDGHLDSEDISRKERTLSQIEHFTNRICQCECYAVHVANEQKDNKEQDKSSQNMRNSPERSESCINGFTEDVLRSSFSKKDKYQVPLPNGTVHMNGDISTDHVKVEMVNHQETIPSVALRNKITRNSSVRNSVCDSEESFTITGVSFPHDVTTTIVNGQEMVMMSTNTYCQLLDELHLLKSQLAKLSDVLQEDLSSEVD